MSGFPLEYDVVVFGSGPAGLQAALHAVRSKGGVAVLGRMKSSALFKAHVENFCCMASVTNGQDILEQGRKQAEKFGARFLDMDVLEVERGEDGRFHVRLESGETLLTWALILSMGISRNRLNVPGEKELLGKGVSYCVDCDGNFFRNIPVVVVGGESAAVSGAMNLLLIAGEVHHVYQEVGVEGSLRYQWEAADVKKHPGRRVVKILGEKDVEGVLLDNGESIEAKGVFIELGAKGALELAAKLDVALDTETFRYIMTNKKQETSVPGVYAAGDITGPPWQMAKAVGEGCVAGIEAAAWAKKMKTKKV